VTPTLTGRLLVAAPSLRDPNFERTVVLIVEHGDEGAVGVVLNRPSAASVSEILPRWAHLAFEPAMVFVGGPVALDGVICLGRSAAGPEAEPGAGASWRPLSEDLGTFDLEGEPPGPAWPGPPAGGLRVFAGHAGWGPAQLEGEVEAGGWIVVDALAGDAFAPAPDDLWPVVLRRQGGALARVANFPDDPSAN